VLYVCVRVFTILVVAFLESLYDTFALIVVFVARRTKSTDFSSSRISHKAMKFMVVNASFALSIFAEPIDVPLVEVSNPFVFKEKFSVSVPVGRRSNSMKLVQAREFLLLHSCWVFVCCNKKMRKYFNFFLNKIK